MKKFWMIFALSGLVLGAFRAMPGYAKDQKLAQTGFQFLTVVSDARAAGMGNALNSLSFGSSSLFFNPAGMADMTASFDVAVSDNRWIAGIHHNTISMAIRPWEGRFGVLGFTVQNVNYGDNLYGTIVVPESQNAQGYLDTGILQPTALSLGVGYAKMLNDRFSVGGQVRMVKQDFGDLTVPLTETTRTLMRFKKNPVAFDFGTLFKTGFKSIAFGMSIRNFSQEVKYLQESYELPMVFTLGISADLMDWIQIGGPKQSAILSIDAKHDRSHAEQVCIGLDYQILKTLSCRIGYISNNDENAMTYGLGISLGGLIVDYAYAPYGVWENVQRMTVRFSL